MSIWNLFELTGGLAVFLYGMIIMNRNLTSIAGEKMKSVMLTLTKSRFRGYMTGLGVTMVNQSSSATTVLEAALVGAGLMTFHQSLAVTLGSELGSTFLAHLIAFPAISKFAALIIASGFFASLICKTKKAVNTSLAVMGFGLLFMGMNMMSSSLTPLRTYQPFLNLMMMVETPALGILIGLGFTMIVQSSGATSGLTIAMAMAGTITLEQAVPINLGAAVGTCITAVLGSLALNWEAKRSAYVHIFFQVIGVVWVYILLMIPFQGERFFIWMIKWFTLNVFQTDSLARQIAMGFTFMPVINHIIIIPFLDHVVGVFEKICPPRESEKPFSVKYLHEQLIDGSVEIALEMAKKEILIVADLIKEMFSQVEKAFITKDPKIIKKICATDSKVDLLHKTIILFLARISENELGEADSKRSMNYLYIENELESIGDVVDKDIMVLAQKMIDQELSFSEDGLKELKELHGKVMENIDRMVGALTVEDAVTAKKIKEKYSNLDDTHYKRLHIERLHKGLKESIGTSSIHLDLINYFNRINQHNAYIADRILWLSSGVLSRQSV